VLRLLGEKLVDIAPGKVILGEFLLINLEGLDTAYLVFEIGFSVFSPLSSHLLCQSLEQG
jgi:hypothetical protein